MTKGPVVSFALDRHLTTEMSAVRAEMLATLEATGFTVKTSQLTVIEAQRGSKIGGATMQGKKLPVKIRIDLDSDETGCRVHTSLTDNLYVPFGVYFGVNTQYQKLFTEIQAAIDAALSRLDPAAAAHGFEAAEFTSRAPTLSVLERANTLMASGEESVVHRAGEMLEGSHDDGIPDAWEQIERVRFDGPAGSHVLTMAETQAHLSVAALVADLPQSLPANLRHEMERFASRVEHALTQGGSSEIRIAIEPGDVPILEFMHLQARIRESLPLRTLHTCHDCKFEKITNPDYERLMQRNAHLRSLMGIVGASVSSSGISPFVVVGTLFKLKRLDPDYVCPRCQGMSADEGIVTFCPQCGDLRKEAVLRVCPKCKHEFGRALPPQPFWQELPPELPQPSAPPAALLGAVAPPNAMLAPAAASPAVAPVPTPSPTDASSRTCPVCNASIPANAGFCTQCGAKLGPQPAGPTLCPKCGASVAPGAHFCGQCGTTMVGIVAPVASPGRPAGT